MANSIIQCASGPTVVSTANTTQYWMPLGGIAVDTVEANQQVIFRLAGTISNFFVNLTANSVAAVSNFRIRKNAANGNGVVSPGSSATGYFEDTTHTDVIAAGDLIAISSVPGASTGTYSMNMTGQHFGGTASPTTMLTASGTLTVATSAVTRFFQLHGMLSDTATEANVKCRMRKAGTLQKLAVNVTTNTRSTTSTFQSRKGGVNGNLTVTYLTSVVGLHEDTTHTDTVAVGDDWNWSLIYGTGATNFITQSIVVDFPTASNNAAIYITSRSGGTVYNASTNTFDPVSGGTNATGTEANTQVVVRNTITYSDLVVNITATTITNAGTVTLRKTGANTALTASITGSTTGLFLDTTHTVVFVKGDKVNHNTVAGTAGTSMTLNSIIASSLFISIPQTVIMEWEES